MHNNKNPATPDYGRNSTYHRVEIEVSAETLWREIENFEDWPGWNPLYVAAAGAFVEGGKVRFTVALPGMGQQRGEATVLEVRPGAGVRYQMVSLGGLTRATRFIEIHPEGPGRCAIVNGETMGGLLGPLLFRAFGERVRQGLQGMNEALKARLENPRTEETPDG